MWKRYFLAPPGTLPHEVPEGPMQHGEYHYLNLDSLPGGTNTGFRAVVMHDGNKPPHPSWWPMLSCMDANSKMSDQAMANCWGKIQHLPGLTKQMGGYEIGKGIGATHAAFIP